jgi:hypothetical protein
VVLAHREKSNSEPLLFRQVLGFALVKPQLQKDVNNNPRSYYRHAKHKQLQQNSNDLEKVQHNYLLTNWPIVSGRICERLIRRNAVVAVLKAELVL